MVALVKSPNHISVGAEAIESLGVVTAFATPKVIRTTWMTTLPADTYSAPY